MRQLALLEVAAHSCRSEGYLPWGAVATGFYPYEPHRTHN